MDGYKNSAGVHISVPALFFDESVCLSFMYVSAYFRGSSRNSE